jgi:hypothetical protein
MFPPSAGELTPIVKASEPKVRLTDETCPDFAGPEPVSPPPETA